MFILTFIVQKGKFQTLTYSNGKFTIKYPNTTTTTIPATEEVLTNLTIKIPLKNFKDGLITKPVPIPNTYEKIDEDNISFFSLFINPIKGVIEVMNISLFIMIVSGDINILVETKAMDAGVRTLIKHTKGKEFFLLCLVFIIFTILGSTVGLFEQSFCFYPILMPVFLKSNIDAMLAAYTLYPATMFGSMFSLSVPSSVVLASYLSGIHFTDGIVFRLIALVFGIAIMIGYFYYYHRKVKLNPEKSVVYNVRNKLIEQFIKKNEEDRDNNNEENKNLLLNDENEEEKEKIEFTWTRIVSLILFLQDLYS